MVNKFDKAVSNFLIKTKDIYKNIEELPIEEVVAHYSKLNENIKFINSNLSKFNLDYKVELCHYLDLFLDFIIDNKEIEYSQGIKNVYTPQHTGDTWINTHLLKDKGILGYLLSKQLKANSIVIFGTPEKEYPYLSYLDKVELIRSNKDTNIEEEYFTYLKENYKKMDVIIIHGLYPFSINFLKEYRNYRPDGKVYCGLDMNKEWMDTIVWPNVTIKEFAQHCDTITTSSRAIMDSLNRNPDVSFACRYIPNSFFNILNTEIKKNIYTKENIFLTVSRIGSPQKNNQDLLMAFAKVHHILKDWSIRLVGPIEEKFQSYIQEYFEEYPELKERVVFTGPITEKKELYQEYAKAKCFVLTSVFEGGTPNVYAEALFHGCMFITSDIDAANEIVNDNELGEIYPCKDVDKLAECMIQIASKSNKEELDIHIQKATTYANKYFDWNRNAKKIAYMLHEPF